MHGSTKLKKKVLISEVGRRRKMNKELYANKIVCDL